MKSQTDLIVSIVAVVFVLIFGVVFYVIKRDVQAPAAPAQVNLTKLEYPAGTVDYSASLGGGTNNAMGGRGGPAGMMGGAPFGSGGAFTGGPPPAGFMKKGPSVAGAAGFGGK